MRDLFFYPLLILVIAGILAVALLPGRVEPTSEADLAQGYVLQGVDLEQLTVAPGTLLRFENAPNGDVFYAVMATNLPRDMATPSAGIFGTLGPDYERYFAGRTLEITVIARQGSPNPLESFDIGYFTAGAGDSGWKRFELTPEFHEFSFRFSPKQVGAVGNDYLGIWPGVEGRSQTVDVQSMSVKVVNP